MEYYISTNILEDARIKELKKHFGGIGFLTLLSIVNEIFRNGGVLSLSNVQAMRNIMSFCELKRDDVMDYVDLFVKDLNLLKQDGENLSLFEDEPLFRKEI